MRKAIIISAAILAAGCSTQQPTKAEIGKPLCISNVVIAGEYSEVSCDVVPPQRLDLEMGNDVGAKARCLDFGGVFIPRVSEGGETICQNVDY